MVKVNDNEREKVISLNDWHVPFHDKKVIELQLEFCRREQPTLILVHELHDFYSVSKYDKDPERRHNLQDEIDVVNEYLVRLRKFCPKSRIVMLNSNHLARLRKYLWSRAPELNSLRALKIEELLGLDELKIEFREAVTYKGVHFKHGDVARKYSSYSARAEFEKEQMSGCSGHTHRLGMYHHRSRAGSFVWVEAGCACKLNAEYISGIANWQHGFAVFEFEKRGNHFRAHAIPIVNYKFSWGNQLYEYQ